jgi:hypothetical protein
MCFEPNQEQIDKLHELKFKAKNVIPDIFKRMGIVGNLPELSILEDTDNHDSGVRIDGWIDVYPFYDIEHSPTVTQHIGQHIRWDVVTEHHVSGVRYYPDGSGEPDSVDVISLYEHLKPKKSWMSSSTVYPSLMQTACLDAVMVWLKWYVTNQWEIESENEMMENDY